MFLPLIFNQNVSFFVLFYAHLKIPAFLKTNILLSGGWYVYQQRNEVHNNCGIEIYYQTDMQTTHDNMLLELFCQIISEPCFNTLRTKEQLGEPEKHNVMLNI